MKVVARGGSIVALLLFAALVAVAFVEPQLDPTHKRWRTAVYKGLIPGKSTRAAVIKVLGRPARVDIPEGDTSAAPEVWLIYKKEGDFPGQFTVAIDKKRNRVLWLELAPDNLKREDAIKHFGDDYVITRYDSCPGEEYIESGPIYESAKGAATYIEYRSRGIALLINYQDKVDGISYLGTPVGLRSLAECKKVKSHHGEQVRASEQYSH